MKRLKITILNPKVLQLFTEMEKLGLIEIITDNNETSSDTNFLSEGNMAYGSDQETEVSEEEIQQWLKDLRTKFADSKLGQQDIDREVEAVRQKRYDEESK